MAAVTNHKHDEASPDPSEEGRSDVPNSPNDAPPEVETPSAAPSEEDCADAPLSHAPNARAEESNGVQDEPGGSHQGSNRGTSRLAQETKKRCQSPSEDTPTTTSKSLAPSTVASGKDAGYDEYRRVKRQKKKTGIRDREGPRHHSLTHIANSVPIDVLEFCRTAAPCTNPGYTGMPDHGKTYDFLEGDFDHQVAQLVERHYDFVEPPPRYVQISF